MEHELNDGEDRYDKLSNSFEELKLNFNKLIMVVADPFQAMYNVEMKTEKLESLQE